MPLNPVRHHPVALAIAKSVLAEQLEPMLGAWEVLSDGAGLLNMIPIYSMPARQLVNRRWNRGWRSGWRYYWTHPAIDHGAIIEVIRLGERKARLGSFSVGSAAISLRDDLALMAECFASDHRRYRPRILRLPWIQMEAIWLNTDSLRVSDKFFSQLDALEGIEFREEAIARAKRLMVQKASAVTNAH